LHCSCIFVKCLVEKHNLVLFFLQFVKGFQRKIKTLLIVPTKNGRDPPLFTGKLLIKFQNILRNNTQVIIRHRVKILFSVISSPINSGTAKVKIVKNERDLPLFTGKLLIKFQNILRNTTHVIIRHRVKILFSVISSPITLERRKWKSEDPFHFWRFSLAVPELLDLIWRKIGFLPYVIW
jgi:hypothetical protein